jgi:hypothetical protein
VIDEALKLISGSKPIVIDVDDATPVEVEDILYKHPAVLFAAVVAKPDAKWDEVPCAFIELKEGAKTTEAEIIAYCRNHMSGFKTLKAVVFGTIPKTSTGKNSEIPAAQPGGIRQGDLGLGVAEPVNCERSESMHLVVCSAMTFLRRWRASQF